MNYVECSDSTDAEEEVGCEVGTRFLELEDSSADLEQTTECRPGRRRVHVE